MNIIEHNLKFNSMNKRTKTNGIVIHYSASSNGTVETIHNYHKNSNGWSGIGYNFVIYKDGTIHRGRPEDKSGAHCVGHNSTKIGICLIGYYDKAHDGTPPNAQMDACIELCKYLCDKYNLKSSDIYRHKDFNSTACPGDVDVEYIKRQVSALSGVVYKVPLFAPLPTILKGTRGEKVKDLQKCLNHVLGTKLAIDGICGNLTRDAIKQFQSKYNLSVDGIYGKKTYAKMQEVLR